ncbi:MAG: sialidase family protein [Promethearchaeota archaeon]
MNGPNSNETERGTLTRAPSGLFCMKIQFRNEIAIDFDIPLTEIFEDYLGKNIVLDLFGTEFHGVFSDGKRDQFYLLDENGRGIMEIYSKLEEKLGKDVEISLSTLSSPGEGGKSGWHATHKLKFSEAEVLSDGLIHHLDIFKQGDAGYHTFRIPGLLVCPNNVVLVFTEARKNSSSDFGEIHCALRRSEDGGITWDPIQIIWKVDNVAVQNPCPVYIPETGEIVLPLLVDRKYPHIMRSKDLGKTWTDAVPIKNLEVENWDVNGPCPGHSIRLQSGRLLVSCHHNEGEVEVDGRVTRHGKWNTHFIYSDDNGHSWTRGHVFSASTNEAMAVELDDGRVLTILRQNQENEDPRKIMLSWSDDGGVSSSEPVVSTELSGPVCQASIIRLEGAPGNRLLFSNPDSEFREKMTIRLSSDGGDTWSKKRIIYHAKAAYSDMALLEDNMVCCAFECGKRSSVHKITFALFNISWLEK